MKTTLLCLLLVFSGCTRPIQLPDVVEQDPNPVVDQVLPVSGSSVSFSMDADQFSNIAAWLGQDNELTIAKAVHVEKDNVTLDAKAGTKFSYEMAERSGKFTFFEPLPTVKANLATRVIGGVALRDVTINADGSGVAGTAKFGSWPFRWLPIDESGGNATAPVGLPEVLAYSTAGCQPCINAKKELSEAKDLPFRVTWKTEAPAWVMSYPTFHWQVDGDDWRQRDRWDGVEKFVEMWKRSRQPKRASVTSMPDAGAAPTPDSEVERVIGLLPTPLVGFVDFGCGPDARWCIAAARKWPGVRVTGVEIDPASAAAARERVDAAGLEGRIVIITGDATTTDVVADVGVAFVWPATLKQMKPQIDKLRAFASYQHSPPLPAIKNGDTWFYVRPDLPAATKHQPIAVWKGMLYSGPQCNSLSCPMCAAIRKQLNSQMGINQ